MANERKNMSGQETGTLLSPEQLQEICKIASTVKYGTVSLVIQDSRLVQIERNEKIRIGRYGLTGK